MDEIPLQETIDKLAEAMIFAEPDDPHALAQLHEHFQTLGKIDSPLPDDILARCEALLEDIIMSDTDQPDEALIAIGDTISVLQSLVAGVLTADQVEYPSLIEPNQEGAEDTDDASSDVPTATAQVTLPANVDESIFSDFLARQGSVLERLEELILALENDSDPGAMDEFKRIIHTIKGETGLLGLPAISELCHTIEDVLITRPILELIDPFLKAKDWLGRMFDAYAGKGEPPCIAQEIIGLLQASPQPTVLSPEKSSNMAPEAAAPAPATTDILVNDPELIGEFINESREHLELADIELLNVESGTHNEETLNAIFRSFHTIKGVAGFIGLPQIQQLAHVSETVLDRARKKTLILAGSTLDVIFDTVDGMKRLLEYLAEALAQGQPPAKDAQLPDLLRRLDELANLPDGVSPTQSDTSDETPQENTPEISPHAKLGEILQNTAGIPDQAIDKAVQIQERNKASNPKLGEVLVRECDIPGKNVAQALRTQRKAQESAKQGQNNKTVKVAETIKVDARRLDQMIDMIGELVIAQAMVNQTATLRISDSTNLTRTMGQLDKITRELQEMATSLRMVPIRSTFQKMARLARDVAKKLEKKVNFVMVGEDTELDKNVVDGIGDPLVHMIRNAVDHGLETNPSDRVEQGKSEVGSVTLRAFHQGGGICIVIQDDGRGLDKEVLLAKAIEKGIVKETDQLSEQEIFALVFAPGFSTARELSDVSGRGVGMDVVKRNIDALRGKIEIQSEIGVGSTFTIRLPLTLAIIEGMVVRLATQRYILPTLSIVRMLQPGELDIKSVLDDGETLLVGDELVPLFRLDRLFNIRGAQQDPTQATVVIVENNGKKIGIVTDELLGQQQIVIKNLGASLKGTPGIAGGAIMPDGKVGLVIDINGMVALVHKNQVPLPNAA